MSEKKTVEVKETFEDANIYGYFGGVQTITPQTLITREVPKEKQYTVDIEPMSDEDCTAINSLNKHENRRMLRWYSSKEGQKFQKANRKIQDFSGDMSSISDKDLDTLKLIEIQKTLVSTDAQKFDIVRKYVSNLSEPHPKAKSGVIVKKVWDNLPKSIKADIYNDIYNISMLSEDDAVNLQ